MLDIGWSEMLVIAVIALLVVGPKDIPKVLRTVGQWVRKARSITSEFQASLDEMVREADLEDARKALDKTRRLNISQEIDRAIDPTGSIKKEAQDLDTAARSDAPAAGSTKDGRKVSAAEAEASDAASEASTPAASESAEVTPGASVERLEQPIPPHSLRPVPEPEVPEPVPAEPVTRDPARAEPPKRNEAPEPEPARVADSRS